MIVLGTSGALSVLPEIRKILKWAQIVWKFHAKVSRKSENGWISEKRTIHLKVPESLGGNQLETKSLFTSQDCPLFREIWNGWCIHHKKFLEIQTRFFIRWKVPQVASLDIPGPITSPCKNQIDWIYWFYLFLCRHTYQSGSKLAKWNDSSSFCEEHGGLCKNQCSL